MSPQRFSEYCPDACSLLSESLDAPLPELQQAALDAHLRTCEACAAFAREAAAFTALLRSATLELPPPLRFEVTRKASYLTQGMRVAAATAVAAAVALVALLHLTPGPGSGGSAPEAGQQVAVVATQQPYVEQHLLEHLTRLNLPTGRIVPE